MLLDRKKYIGFGDIENDLMYDSDKELLHKCIVVEQSISDGDFPLDEALAAYRLSKEDYDKYVAKKSQANIFSSLSGNTLSQATFNTSYAVPHVVLIYIEMLKSTFDEQLQALFKERLGKIKTELEGISDDYEKIKQKV